MFHHKILMNKVLPYQSTYLGALSGKALHEISIIDFILFVVDTCISFSNRIHSFISKIYPEAKKNSAAKTVNHDRPSMRMFTLLSI